MGWRFERHLIACGRAVGLPAGQMGNSEVGHLNLGAGSIIMQGLTRIEAPPRLPAYERDETDEFTTPVLVGEEARIRSGDSVLGFNFRPDRTCEITEALAEPGFEEVDRGGTEPVGRPTTMTEYEEGGAVAPVAFPPQRPAITLERLGLAWRPFAVTGAQIDRCRPT